MSVATWNLSQVGLLLRAQPGELQDWVTPWRKERALFRVATVALGAGLYGAAMGCWRSELQALYTAIKLPLVILLTTFGNGLLNGMLAPLLGLNLTLRQALMTVLLTFTIASIVLGAFSPVATFVVWNTPPLTDATRLGTPEYGLLQLTHVVFIAFAGVTGHLCLVPLLRQWSARPAVAHRVLFAWLATNLFLGSQIAWVLRPFIWDPARPVEFIGQEYLHGSFYETLFEAARRLIFS